MSRFILSLAVSLVGLSLLASAPTEKGPASSRATHKSKVPVVVSTVFGEGKATVSFRFEQSVTEAAIGFRGLDGLAVNSRPVLDKTQYARGETLVLDIPITPGPGRSHLVVDITGKFRGQRRMGVQTFAFGKPTPEQEKTGPGSVVTTTDGRRIKVMPVKPQ